MKRLDWLMEKKVIAKKDQRKGLINIVKESKMFENRHETSLATTMLT